MTGRLAATLRATSHVVPQYVWCLEKRGVKLLCRASPAIRDRANNITFAYLDDSGPVTILETTNIIFIGAEFSKSILE
jgi:hypothetical protein